MQTLSKEAEQTLIAAIEKAAAFVNSGMSPNDAIIKSAAAANIPAGHINLMVHAYNTGRTTKQREQGENTLEKAADFQLADAPTVLEALYPKTVKTSAEIVRQQIVSTDYAVSPAGMLARRRAEQEKVAAAQIALPEKTYKPYPRDEQFAAERAYSQKRAAQLAQEELRRQANAAYTKSASAMDELAEFFKRPGNMSFADATKQVELRLGDEGVSVLNKIAEVYPHFKKQAATKNDHFGDNPVYGLVQNVLESVTDYVKAAAKIEKKAEGFGKKKAPEFLTGSVLQDSVDFSDEITLKQAYTPSGHHPTITPGSVPPALAAMFNLPQSSGGSGGGGSGGKGGAGGGGGAGNNPPGPNRNNAGGGKGRGNGGGGGGGRGNGGGGGGNNNNNGGRGNGGGGNNNRTWSDFTFGQDLNRGGVLAGARAPTQAVGEIIGEFGGGASNRAEMLSSVLGLDKDPDKMRQRAYQSISTPDHELTLKNIKAQATLHDLMLNDDVISGHDPREVAIAFNEIAGTAPNIVDAPAVLASILRKRLEAGQLADFDAKQLVEMDKLKAERDDKMLSAKRTEQELA